MGHYPFVFGLRACRGRRRRTLRIGVERLEDRTVPSGLDVAIYPPSVFENSGRAVARGTVTRSGDLTQPLLVSLASSDTTEVVVPASITIASGQTQATFDLDAVDDLLVDGTQRVTVAASAGVSVPLSFRTSHTSLMAGIRDIAVQPDGKFVVVGGSNDFFVARYNANGTPDTTFSGDGVASADIGGSIDTAEAVAVQADGKIVVGGYGRLGSTSNPFGIALARFNTDGSLDTSFGTGGKYIAQPSPGFYNEIWDLAIAPGGDIIAVGTTTYSATGNDFGVFRFSSNGRPNPNFGGGAGFVATDIALASDRAFGVAIQPDGKILAGGHGTGGSNFQARYALVRYLPDGRLDTTFDVDGKVITDFSDSSDTQFEGTNDILLYPDGRILAVGQVGNANIDYDTALLRYNTNGSLDTTFGGGDGKVRMNLSTGDDRAFDAALQPDGRILIAGANVSNQAFLARFLPSGDFEAVVSTVSTSNSFLGVALGVLPDGDVVVGGTAASGAVAGFLERFSAFTPLSGSAAIDVLDNESGNRPPIANNDSYATDEDTPLTVAAPGVLGNDSDADANTLSAVKVSDPANGTLTLNANGSFTYTPNANFNGTDSFTYKANDGSTDSGVATVTITVRAVNDAPMARDDAYSTDEDTPLTVAAPGVLGNDSDVDGNTLTTVKVSDPANGTLTLNADGSFTYTPNANFNGTDSFTYKANDGNADSGVATVTITVRAVNDAPVARDDSYATDEDTPLVIAAPGVLGNDGDVDGNTLTTVKVSDPANGTLTLNADGSFTYTPNANFNGSDSFTYKVNDGAVDSNIATVTITVRAVNDAPVARDDAYSTDEDIPLTVAAPGVLGNDSDVEGSALSAVKVSDPANGTLILNADGSFTYTPNANFNGTDSFTYKANDGNADSGIATVTITVRAVNDAPVARDDSYATDEDTPLVIAAPGVLGNDGDVDGNALSAVLVGGASHGTLALNADGSFTYTPAANFNGSDSFTYKANDGAADSGVATVTITVRAVNDAPVARNDNYAIDEDTPLTIAAPGVLGNDSDIDGNTLAAIKVSDPSNGTLTLNADGSFTYTPDANFNGTDSFTYKANDGNADSGVATVTITVRAVNDAPVARNDSYSVVSGNTLNAAAPGVLSNDRDADGDTLTTLLVGGPASGSLTLNADGSFTYTPHAGFVGTDAFTYRVSDGSALSDVATVSLTVNPQPATEGKVTGNGRLAGGALRFHLNVDARVVGGALAYSGQMRFEDVARGIDLKSTAITHVRVEADGVRAAIHGSATLNGRAGYTFIVTVEDRGESGAGRDVFRIRITGPSNFAYDSSEYAGLAGVIEQGNIQVRKRA